MSAWLRMLGSSVGSKFLMGLTGLLLFLFVVAHLTGNLLVFKGRDALNAYAQGLHDLGPLLWVMRAGLLGIFVLHIATAFRLNNRNHAARPVQYHAKQPLASTFASRYMMRTGLIVLAFVVYHLLHFTIGVFGAEHHVSALAADAEGRKDVFGMVVQGFSSPVLALAYVVFMALLGLHLVHGISSAFQSLGITRPRYRELVKKTGIALTLAIVLGNCLIPLSIMTGAVKDDGQGKATTTAEEGSNR